MVPAAQVRVKGQLNRDKIARCAPSLINPIIQVATADVAITSFVRLNFAAFQDQSLVSVETSKVSVCKHRCVVCIVATRQVNGRTIIDNGVGLCEFPQVGELIVDGLHLRQAAKGKKARNRSKLDPAWEGHSITTMGNRVSLAAKGIVGCPLVKHANNMLILSDLRNNRCQESEKRLHIDSSLDS